MLTYLSFGETVWGCERRNHVTKESVRSVRSQKGAYRTGRFPYKWFGGCPRDETGIIYYSCDQSIPAGVRMSVIVTVLPRVRDNATDDLSQYTDCKHCGVVCKRPRDLMFSTGRTADVGSNGILMWFITDSVIDGYPLPYCLQSAPGINQPRTIIYGESIAGRL